MLGATLGGISLPAYFSCQKVAPPRVARPSGGPGPEPGSESGPEPGPNEQIGVGIIGCGRRNGQLVIGKGGQGAPPPHARIVAVADFNPMRAAEWARNYRAKAHKIGRAHV